MASRLSVDEVLSRIMHDSDSLGSSDAYSLTEVKYVQKYLSLLGYYHILTEIIAKYGKVGHSRSSSRSSDQTIHTII